MTFLAPWALALGGISAATMVVLHLVARHHPAAYLLPTARFIPEQRALVSRMATRPRDLLLLALRVLVVVCASVAFARPVLSPSRGTMVRVILLDRSRSVANAGDAVARARALAQQSASVTVIAFDTTATILPEGAWDSLSAAPRSESHGSLSAALVAARRASVALAERADSIELDLVSPIAAAEFDDATSRARTAWPGAIRIERVAMRSDSVPGWRLEHALPASDQLGPAMGSVRAAPGSRVIRLVRSVPAAGDSAYARAGNTVVHWDTATAPRIGAEGLAVGDDVIVAALGRVAMGQAGRVLARWADGTPAAEEHRVGSGCMRSVGIMIPRAGDIALHPPFQRIVRGLLAPCGFETADVVASSTAVARLAGTGSQAAAASVLRAAGAEPAPPVRWLLAAALVFALAELVVRARPAAEAA